MHPRNARLAGGIAEYEAVFIGVIAQPDTLGGQAEAVIAVGMRDRGDIYRKPCAVLARVAGKRAYGIVMGIVAIVGIGSKPFVPHLPLEPLGSVGVMEPVFIRHSRLLCGDEHLSKLHRNLELYEGGIELRLANVAEVSARVYEIVRNVIIFKTVLEIDEAGLFPS